MRLHLVLFELRPIDKHLGALAASNELHLSTRFGCRWFFRLPVAFQVTIQVHQLEELGRTDAALEYDRTMRTGQHALGRVYQLMAHQGSTVPEPIVAHLAAKLFRWVVVFTLVHRQVTIVGERFIAEIANEWRIGSGTLPISH